MLYAKIKDGKVIQIASLKAILPHVSLPANPSSEFLSENGVLPLAKDPAFDKETQKLNNILPVISGNEVIIKEAVNLTAEEIVSANKIKAAKIRFYRDSLIAKSDWTQVADNQISATEKTAWTTYRQALRDITKQATFPNSVIWPTDPNYVAPEAVKPPTVK